MKKIVTLILMIALILSLTACFGEEEATGVVTPSDTAASVYDSDDLDSSWDSGYVSYIKLKGDSVTKQGNGVIVDGSQITITASGTYAISGTLDDGQIVVNTENEDTMVVKLVLNGADITCSTSAPIYVINAEKTVITLAEGTENYVTDGSVYVFEDAETDEPNAAIFSDDDLTINGDGWLTVTANYNNGIQSKDDLKIISGHITVYATNDGIKGRDSINVRNGNITVTAGGDGMQSNNDEDSEMGYISIEGGIFNITAGADGIQAETSLTISGGSINIVSGGGSVNGRHVGTNQNPWVDNWNGPNNAEDFPSAKGLKAGVDLTITGGTINIDSADDSLHSNDSLMIIGGSMVLASGDDGIHADSNVMIHGGEITVTTCYEGIESSVVTINDGDIHLVASDDGINATSGNDGDFMGGQQPGMGGQPAPPDFEGVGDDYLFINGGYLAIDSGGDGLDINGSIYMTDGVVIINGPASSADSALDYLGEFKITGGFLAAVGSIGMAMAPSTSSTQYSVMVNLVPSLPAGTMFHLETEDGTEILTFVPTKEYQSVVLCLPELQNGTTYIVYSGGSSTGIAADGLYSGGSYTAGTQILSFTISDMVTKTGEEVDSFPPGGTGPGGGGPGNQPF